MNRARARWVAAAVLAVVAGLLVPRAPLGATTPALIATFAGGGAPGDGGSPLRATFTVNSIATDAAGNVYLSDSAGQRVRRISPGADGVIGAVQNGGVSDADDQITTVAGSGYATGALGDGGPALSASLSQPRGIAVDAGGDMYIADTGHNRIRKVAPDGTISTVAGTGVIGATGDGGPAAAAQLAAPSGVTLDSGGNLYVADTNNQRVRFICLQASACTANSVAVPSGDIATVAGNGNWLASGDGGPAVSATMSFPNSVVVDPGGNLYIATGDNQIRKVTTAGIISTLDGATYCVNICRPSALTMDAAGTSLYVANDAGTPDILKEDLTSTSTPPASTIVAGRVCTSTAPSACQNYTDGQPATSGDLTGPVGVALAGGALFVAETENNFAHLRKVDSAGLVWTVAGGSYGTPLGNGDGGPRQQAQLAAPAAATVDAAGNLYIADVCPKPTSSSAPPCLEANSGQVRFVCTQTTACTLFPSAPSTCGPQQKASCALLVAPGTVATVPNAGATLALAIDSAGDLYVADIFSTLIKRVDGATGQVRTVAGNDGTATASSPQALQTRLVAPAGLALDPTGHFLYVADSGSHEVWKLDLTAQTMSVFAGGGSGSGSGDGGPATKGVLNGPQGLAVDASNNVYIADAGDNVVRRVDGASGVITTVAGTYTAGDTNDGGIATAADLNAPVGVAVDTPGDVFIADSANNAIRMVCGQASCQPPATSASPIARGTITTWVGQGSGSSVGPGFAGDGGPVSGAQLYQPFGVSGGTSGTVYIADSANSRIRITSVAPATFAAPDPPAPAPAPPQPSPSPSPSPTPTPSPSPSGGSGSGSSGSGSSGTGSGTSGGDTPPGGVVWPGGATLARDVSGLPGYPDLVTGPNGLPFMGPGGSSLSGLPDAGTPRTSAAGSTRDIRPGSLAGAEPSARSNAPRRPGPVGSAAARTSSPLVWWPLAAAVLVLAAVAAGAIPLLRRRRRAPAAAVTAAAAAARSGPKIGIAKGAGVWARGADAARQRTEKSSDDRGPAGGTADSPKPRPR